MSKREWGNAVWFLFHTLAEKLRPEYSNAAPIIYHHFRNICSTLPCPTCAQHAVHNLKIMSNRRVTSKAELAHFLFDFHNKVNLQLHKQQMSQMECRKKYYYANTRNIIINFKRVMTVHRSNPKLLLDTQTQRSNVNSVLAWLQANYYIFYL